MGKSMKANSDVVCLPEEIINQVLLTLPINSLRNCRAVCRSWRSLIESSTFIHTHLSRNQNDDAHLVLLQFSMEKDRTRRLHQSLHWDNPSLSEYSKLNINPLIKAACNNDNKVDFDSNLDVEVVGTINGLVCLVTHPRHPDQGLTTIFIWNPCIRKYVILPTPSHHVDHGRDSFDCYQNHWCTASYAFGYDSRTRDYKVLTSVSIRTGDKINSYTCQVKIWSLAKRRGSSWRTLKNIPADFLPGKHVSIPPALVNGALHWIQRHTTTAKDYFIVSFDMVTESFGEIVIPQALREEIKYISKYRDSLAVFQTAHDYDEAREVRYWTCVHMWVMKEYGVPDSWAKLFTVHTEGHVSPTLAFSFTKTGELLLSGRPEKLVDPKTKQITDFRIHDYCNYRFMDYFSESLILLGQPNAISY